MVFFKNFRIKNVLLFMSFLFITIPLFTQGYLTYSKAKAEIYKSATDQITQQALTLSKYVKSVAYSEKLRMENAINTAKMIVLVGYQSARNISIDENDASTFFATNQITKQSESISLPAFKINGKKILFSTEYVDQIQKSVETDATIFQMFEKGLVRISTTILDDKGERAFGTFIPTDSPVYEKISQGEPYVGRAFVVNKWYDSVYEPIKDETGKVLGALFVGYDEKKFQDPIKDDLSKIFVGKTGYIYILDDKGNYLLSKDRLRDGENIWDSQDSNGNFFIQEMIRKASVLKQGQADMLYYPWINKGETNTRQKFSAFTYFPEWNWVIGASAYVDDYTTATNQVKEITLIIILIAILLGSITIYFFANSISRPLVAIQNTVARIKSGDLDSRIKQDSRIIEVQNISKDFDDILELLSDRQVISESFLSGMNDPALKTDNNLIVTEINDKMLAMLGFTREDVVGKMTCGQLTKTPLCDTDKCTLYNCIKNKKATTVETTVTTKNGETFPVRISSGALKNTKGEVVGGFEVIQDLSAIHSIVKAMADISTGNLMTSVNPDLKKRDDSSGNLARSVDKMIQTIKGLIQKISQQASSTAAAAQQLSASSLQVNSLMKQVSSTIEQVANGAKDVSKNSIVIKETTIKTEESAMQGGVAAMSVNRKMSFINTTAKENAQKIKDLDGMSTKISNIVKTINSISEQTNLLALNAAIEAARAGESGRGFAVVADEVRKLAEESKSATEKISALIENIQTGIRFSVLSMEKNSHEVETGTLSVQEAVKSFEAIPLLVKNISQSMISMVAVAEQNAVGSDQLFSSVQQITSSMDQVSSAAKTLSQGAEKLRTLISNFKIGDSAEDAASQA